MIGYLHYICCRKGCYYELKKFIAPLLVGVLAFAIAGCGNNTNQAGQTPKEVKIGATAGPHAQVAEAVAKEAKKQGIDLKVVEFSDYVNTRLKLSLMVTIQLNAYQTRTIHGKL